MSLDPLQPVSPSRSNADRTRREEAAKRAMRDLAELARTLTIRADVKEVEVVDDLDRRLVFPATGRGKELRLGATPFTVRARWTDTALSLTMTTNDGLEMSELLMPTSDGTRLFVLIRIVRPEFEPPIKNIERVYTREPS